jgi:hypothetical protein
MFSQPGMFSSLYLRLGHLASDFRSPSTSATERCPVFEIVLLAGRDLFLFRLAPLAGRFFWRGLYCLYTGDSDGMRDGSGGLGALPIYLMLRLQAKPASLSIHVNVYSGSCDLK